MSLKQSLEAEEEVDHLKGEAIYLPPIGNKFTFLSLSVYRPHAGLH